MTAKLLSPIHHLNVIVSVDWLRWIDDYRRPPNPSPHGIGERVTGDRKRDVSRQTVQPMASFSALARPV